MRYIALQKCMFIISVERADVGEGAYALHLHSVQLSLFRIKVFLTIVAFSIAKLNKTYMAELTFTKQRILTCPQMR